MSYNPHTMAGVIAGGLVLNAVLANLIATLTPDQRAKLRQNLIEASQEIEPIDEFEPDCSEYQKARFAEWIEMLAP